MLPSCVLQFYNCLPQILEEIYFLLQSYFCCSRCLWVAVIPTTTRNYVDHVYHALNNHMLWWHPEKFLLLEILFWIVDYELIIDYGSGGWFSLKQSMLGDSEGVFDMYSGSWALPKLSSQSPLKMWTGEILVYNYQLMYEFHLWIWDIC